jgi:hypothetical protein
MDSALTIVAVLAIWWIVQLWVLPRFGVPT